MEIIALHPRALMQRHVRNIWLPCSPVLWTSGVRGIQRHGNLQQVTLSAQLGELPGNANVVLTAVSNGPRGGACLRRARFVHHPKLTK
jgi:hypothetical protein